MQKLYTSSLVMVLTPKEALWCPILSGAGLTWKAAVSGPNYVVNGHVKCLKLPVELFYAVHILVSFLRSRQYDTDLTSFGMLKPGWFWDGTRSDHLAPLPITDCGQNTMLELWQKTFVCRDICQLHKEGQGACWRHPGQALLVSCEQQMMYSPWHGCLKTSLLHDMASFVFL